MKETSLTRIEGAPPVAAPNLADLKTLGEVFTRSGFFADTKDAAQAIVKIMAGQELGFAPIASMTGVYIVKGRVSLSANLIAAAIKRSGKYNFRVRKHSDQECEIEFFEQGESIGTSAFTRADAAKAGTQNMDKFPRNMLYARAMSNGAKWYCPDIFGGPVYTPDELGAAIDGETGEVLSVPEERAPRPAAAPSNANEPSTETRPEPAGPALTGLAKQIDALRQTLGWTPENLLEVIQEEFKIVPTGEYPYPDILNSLDTSERKTLIDLLKAELQQKSATA